MKEFGLNYKDGMFLGKQELERQNLISQSLSFGLRRLSADSYMTDTRYGLFNLEKMRVSGNILSDRIAFAAQMICSDASFDENKLGRIVVGFNASGAYIGLPLFDGVASNLVGKEAVILSSSYPSGEATKYVYFETAETNYEPYLINISSGGVASGFDSNTISLFRQGLQGRYTKIKTEGNQVLTVQSIDTNANTITFAEASVVAETNTRFMFVHTLSPLVGETVEPLYTYPSCSVSLSDYASLSDNTKFLAAKVTFESGVPTNVVLQDSATNVKWLDTVPDDSIDEDKLLAQSVTRGKLSEESFGYRKVTSYWEVGTAALPIEPGFILTNGPVAFSTGEKIRVRTPAGFDADACALQPAKLILGIKASTPSMTGSDLMGLFVGDGVTLYFDKSIDDVVWDVDSMVMFDFYWLSTTLVLIHSTLIDLG